MKKWQHYLSLVLLLLASVLSPVSAWAQEATDVAASAALVSEVSDEAAEPAPASEDDGLDVLRSQEGEVDLDELIRNAPQVKAIPNVVTRIYATTRDGSPITKDLLKWEAFRINVDFALPNNTVRAGDTSVIQVPSTLAFTEASNFEVRDASGQNVVANATIRPGARTVTLTYTAYAQNNSDVRGSLFFYARINHAEVTEKGNVDLNFVVENQRIPGGSVPFEGAPIPRGNPMDKSGWQLPGQPNKIRYILAVNRRGENRNRVTVRDILKDEGLSIDRSSVSITKGHWVYQNGGWVLQNAANGAGSYSITWDSGDTGFTVDFGNLDTQTGFEILYTVNIPYNAADGEKFGNYAEMMDANGLVANTNYDYNYSIAGGNAEGYTFVVKVHKHDGQGNNLAGAEFEVVRDANQKVVGTITTDAQGNGQLGGLLRDAYTLRETKAPDGYERSTEEIKIQGSEFGADKSVLKQVVNVPSVTTVDIRGTKTWDDANNQDGLRPDQVTIKLLANGAETGQTATATAANNWTYAFTGLDAKDAQGQTITYSVAEDAVVGYTSTVNGYDLTNHHTPELVTVQGTKTWDDANDQDGLRPSQVTVKLLADGLETGQTATVTAADNWTYAFTNLPKNKDGQAIVYTVQEEAVADYTTSYQGTNITNTHTPGQTGHTVQKVWEDGQDQDGLRPVTLQVQLYANDQAVGNPVDLTAANNWSYSWTGLPEKANGQVIQYRAQEVATPADYQATATTTGNVTTLTNRHTPAVTSVQGTKTWADADNQDGLRPSSIKVNLLADGVLRASKDVTAADNWQYQFDNLPKYVAGREVVYTITEDAVADYTGTVDGFNLTNTHTPGQTSLTVTKQWQDAEDQDGLRPSEVQVQLYADDVASGQPVSLTAANNWTYSWTGLAEKAQGQTIQYSVREVAVPAGYTSTVSELSPGNVTIVNQHTPATTQVSGTKTWEDADNQDGKRPESVTVQLLANGQVVASQVVTAANDWTYQFDNLPAFRQGQALVYTVQEMLTQADADAGYSPTYDGTNITNHYTPEQTTYTVVKTWNDKNDQDKLRPSSIQVQLYADGQALGQAVTLSADNQWTHTFEGLAKYQAGQAIVYTVAEVEVPSGYTATVAEISVNHAAITNTHEPKKPEDPGKKDLPKTGSAEIFLLGLAGLMALSGLGILGGKRRLD